MGETERREEETEGAWPERLLTIPEAARVLAVPESWLRERVRLRRVAHRRLGKHVRFTASDLEAIVDGAAQHALAPKRMAHRWRQPG
ncbi:helix-turn-helix domain-containing protein [Nocardiopsis alba]|uniref:Helix-turn-helix domain-containing protein n=1 Tax=Nocardiopsis alba TaxID=53437 RepID=A0ABV5DT87_9ACTN